MVGNILTTKTRELDGMKSFISRFTNMKQEAEIKEIYYDSIKKQKVISFEAKKTNKTVTISQDENKSFFIFFPRFEGKKVNLRIITDWPVTSKPLRSLLKMTRSIQMQKVCSETIYNHYALRSHHVSQHPQISNAGLRCLLFQRKIS